MRNVEKPFWIQLLREKIKWGFTHSPQKTDMIYDGSLAGLIVLAIVFIFVIIIIKII